MKKAASIFLFLTLLFSCNSFFAQQISVPASLTACPNQVVTVTPTWNNVSSINYTLVNPPGPLGTQVPLTFTISQPNAGTASYTLYGAGINSSGPITASVVFNLTVTQPAPITFTTVSPGNSGDFCYGANGSFTSTIGGNIYNVTGGCAGNLASTSNIITIPNLNSSCSGIYTVATVINGCARTGTTQINVAPNNQITVSPPVSVCEGANTVNLTAALQNGANFQWYDPSNNPLNPANSANVTLNNLTINQSGSYFVSANIISGTAVCQRTAATQVTVIQTDQVTASASPGNILCQGTTLVLNANVVNASGFTWVGPNSFFSTSQNPSIPLVSPLNNGNYAVTALFVGPGLTCSTTAAVAVQVVPVTQPVITLPASVCENPNASVSMSVNAGPAAQSYTWQGPCLPGYIGQTQSVSAQPNCSGTYYATAKFSINTTECVSTASAVLYVVPINTITVISPGQVCAPTNAFLQANSNGANLFTWVGPNNFSTPGQNVVVYNTSPAASGIYTVTAAFGGGNLTCYNSNTLQLTVNPVLNFTLVPRQMMCYGTPFTVLGPSGATTYTWTSSTGFTSNSKDILIPEVKPSNTGSYTLEISLGPCKTSAETYLQVLDVINFTLTPQNKTICRDEIITLQAGMNGGSENYAYMWSPSLYMDSPTGPTKTFAPLTSVLYNLTVHDIACPNYSATTPVSITVNQPPIPDLHIAEYGCEPFEVYLDSKVSDKSAIITWDFGGIMKYQGDRFIRPQEGLSAGVYNLTVYTKGKNNCSGTYVYPNPIIVNPSPGADFFMNPELPTSTDLIEFTATNKYEPITRFTWNFQGGKDLLDTAKIKPANAENDSSNIRNPQRIYSIAGKYPVVLIAENDKGCIDTVFKMITIIDDLQIFIPNSFTPNGDGINDVFFVKGQGIKLENFSLEIIDRWGNIVFTTKDINEGWDGKVRGEAARDGTYTCYIKAVGMNGEGRRELTTYLNIIK